MLVLVNKNHVKNPKVLLTALSNVIFFCSWCGSDFKVFVFSADKIHKYETETGKQESWCLKQLLIGGNIWHVNCGAHFSTIV